MMLLRDLLVILFQGCNPFVRHVSQEGVFVLHMLVRYDVKDVVLVIDRTTQKWSPLISDLLFLHRKKKLNVRIVNISKEKIVPGDVHNACVVSYCSCEVLTHARLGLLIGKDMITDATAQFTGAFLDTGKFIAVYDYALQQALECVQKDGEQHSAEKQDLKIQAIVTCYNEEDVIGHTIRHLVAQGIHVHVIDNWSIDRSESIIQEFVSRTSLVTTEKYPLSGPSETYDWTELLTKVQEYAMAHHKEFDWFVHHDADEVREAPFEGVAALAEGIRVVDALGYNAIDHTVLNFVPIPDGYDGSQSLTTYLRYFSFGNTDGDFIQIKAWKSSRVIDLVSDGGHRVRCNGREEKIFPYKFLLRHYSLRSHKQAQKKIFHDRVPRWNQGERAKDWHAHYNDIVATNALPEWHKERYIYFQSHESFYKDYVMQALTGVGIKRISMSNQE